MASAIEKVIEIAANNLFDNSSVQSCLTAVTDLSNNLDTRINVIIDSAPETLNTLNELAAALGDDANYATATAASLATKYSAGSDASFNDLSANDISGVNFFTTGGKFIGDISGNNASFNVVDINTLNLTTPLSASKVGLGNVDDESKATMFSNPTFTGKVIMDDLSGNDISLNNISALGTLTVDTINEKTSTNGVVIEGVLLKDSDISANDAKFNDVSGVNFFANGNFIGDLQGNADTATTAETVTTAAQPNITSVGTLTSLVVSGDLSGNDASFNVVDITSLKVGGITIDANGTDLSTKEVKDLSDVSYNTVSSGQVLSWNTSGFFEPVTQTAGNLNINSDISINKLDSDDISCNTLKTNGVFTMDGQLSMGAHIIPSSNSVFDIGSAAYKIRHLFLSDSSLWIGDSHKIDVSGGKMKFKKRKSDTVPQEILDISNNSDAHIVAIKDKFGFYDISQVNLHHWYEYAKDAPGINLTAEQLFVKDDNFDTNKDLLDSTILPIITATPVDTPVAGTMKYNTTDNKLYIYTGSVWTSSQFTA